MALQERYMIEKLIGHFRDPIYIYIYISTHYIHIIIILHILPKWFEVSSIYLGKHLYRYGGLHTI